MLDPQLGTGNDFHISIMLTVRSCLTRQCIFFVYVFLLPNKILFKSTGCRCSNKGLAKGILHELRVSFKTNLLAVFSESPPLFSAFLILTELCLISVRMW